MTHDSAGGNKNSDRTPLEELNLGAFTLRKESPTTAATESMNKSPTEHEQASMPASRPVTRKETFQIKSGIWAHFSSRGLIDLSITAPKKVDLSDAGVVGRLSNRSEAGATMGIGPDFPSSAGPTGGGG